MTNKFILNQNLLDAIEVQDIELIKQCLKDGAEIDGLFSYSHTYYLELPLFAAVKTNNPKIVRFLVKSGANPNIEDNAGNTAAIVAARLGYKKMIQVLEESGADLHHENKFANTPLILAADNGQAEVVEYLLKNNNIPPFKTQELKRAYFLAAYSGRGKVIQAFAKHRKIFKVRDKLGYTPLMYLSMRDSAEGVQALLKAGVNPKEINKQRETALICAANNSAHRVMGILGRIKRLVNRKDSEGNTALIHTIQNNDPEGFKILLDCGARTDILTGQKESVLFAAAHTANAEFIQEIIQSEQSFRSFNIYGLSPLHYAVEMNNYIYVDKLLSAGADVNITSKNFNETPLMLAINLKNISLFSRIMASKPDIHIKTKLGTSALMLAAQKNFVYAIKELLKHGARLEEKNNIGNTALIYAAEYKSPEAVALLLKAGANPNPSNIYFETPLHMALHGKAETEEDKQERLFIVEKLLQAGGNVQMQDYHRLTAWEMAQNMQDEALITLMKPYAEKQEKIYPQPFQKRTVAKHKYSVQKNEGRQNERAGD